MGGAWRKELRLYAKHHTSYARLRSVQFQSRRHHVMASSSSSLRSSAPASTASPSYPISNGDLLFANNAFYDTYNNNSIQPASQSGEFFLPYFTQPASSSASQHQPVDCWSTSPYVDATATSTDMNLMTRARFSVTRLIDRPPSSDSAVMMMSGIANTTHLLVSPPVVTVTAANGTAPEDSETSSHTTTDKSDGNVLFSIRWLI